MNSFQHKIKLDTWLVMGEAGGNSAHSCYRQIQKQIPASRILAVDANPKALLFWSAMGCHVMLEDDFIRMGYGNRQNTHTMLPTDEHLRRKYGYQSPFSTGDIKTVHSKRYSRDVLMKAGLKIVKLPREVEFDIVAKPSYGAGSKGHVAVSNFGADAKVILEKIHFDNEYDVDFNTEADLWCPRICWNLVNGNDTFCTLVGPHHEEYEPLVAAAKEVVAALGIKGVGDVQLMRRGNTFYYLEAAMRFSGSSWLNLHSGANIALGIHPDPFVALNCSTKAGLVQS